CYATAVVPTGPTAPAARCCPPSTPPTRAPAPPTDAPDHQAGQPDPAHAPPAPRATTPPDQAPGNITSYLLRKQRTIQSGASTTNPRTPGLNVYGEIRTTPSVTRAPAPSPAINTTRPG